MRLSTFIESDSFQIGIIADAPVPHWDEKSLEKGIATSKTGILLATYPDLDFRKRSIAVTALDADDEMTEKEKTNYALIGSAKIKAPHKTIDVGCVPTICDGTSGRLKFDSPTIIVEVYGDTKFEPKSLIVKFPENKIIKLWASRIEI